MLQLEVNNTSVTKKYTGDATGWHCHITNPVGWHKEDSGDGAVCKGLPQLVTLFQQGTHFLCFLVDGWLRRDDPAVLVMHGSVLNDLHTDKAGSCFADLELRKR